MPTTKSDLLVKRCKPCEASMGPLPEAQIRLLVEELSGWQSKGQQIFRTFRFNNYYETMAFVNAVAFLSHREDHHPDLEVGYNKCVVRYSTHAVGGLSENDFICAAKVDTLVE
ncbi:MAG TPA: 4a-hydroxytetrahydrobiopterin dehydratase [Tepidisphaeraceae bacterium]|nr:4a-hydroxytetrahydrobiopterin dehydratase [Tepidisphaeraceae bacterium]